MYRAAIVDNDPSFLERAERFLPKLNKAIRVIPVADASELETVLRTRNVDVIVCNHDPDQGVDGLSVFRGLLRKDDRRPFILMTMNGTEEMAMEALNMDVDYYLKKNRSTMDFFSDLAGRIVLSVEKRRIEEERSLNERRLKALVRLANMYNHSFTEIAHYVLEESVRLTRSGMGYFALYDDKTRKLTMYAWSQGGMKACKINDKPIVYDLDSTGIWGEPIRQRQAVVVNDYNAPNTQKKGIPVGHVPLQRLLMIPMFYNGAVVGTAGVGNKELPYDNGDLNQLTLLMEGLSNIYLGRLSERAMYETENRYEQILKLAPVGLMGLDADGAVSECNQRMQEILSLIGLDEPIGKRLTDSRHDFALQLSSLVKDVRQSGKGDKREMTLKVGQNILTLLVNIRPHYDLDQRINGTYIAIEDLTDLKSSLAMLERAAYQINVVDRVMHQDVMNSIHTVKGYLGVISSMTDDQGILDNIHRIEGSINAMTGQMDFSREYKNVGVLNPGWHRLSELVDNAVTRLSVPKGLVKVNLGNLEMFADPALEKVFQHLLDNSMKHGGRVSLIEVKMSLEDGRISVIYQDDGRGIDPKNKERIFEKGFGEGSGYGMFLSKEILSMTDFDIRETSRNGSGVRFEITGPPSNFRLYS